MDFDTIFLIGNRVIMTGWFAIVAGLFLPKFRTALFAWSGLILPALLAVAYVWLIYVSMTGARAPGAGMGSLGAVKALFASDAAMTGGWYHYLAFDLFVGTWIARDGLERGLSRGAWRLIIIPLLLLTLSFGPAGFLVYLVIRTLFLRGPKDQAASVQPAPAVH
jgi:hypothetical protein